MENFVNELQADVENRDKIVHHERIPGQQAKFGQLSAPLSAPLVNSLLKKGILKLYSHQADAINLVRKGKNVAAVTPTASGKTLIYNLPVMEKLLADPDAKALYLFPIKALAQDQLKNLREFAGETEAGKKVLSMAEIYDGDTSTAQRSKIKKKPPQVILTNPDMLHLGILPYHSAWADFIRNLKFVVIDEVHSYRGIFGSHVGHIIRRLRRICRYYGSNPQFITLSATMANPSEFIGKLTGMNFSVVAENGAPVQTRHFFFWNSMSSPYTEATALLRTCLEHKFKTIVFTKSRKITDLIFRWLVEGAPWLEKKVSSYRAGYLPEERREIETRLFSGDLQAVITTSALEVGIDIGGLDVCLLVGYPGTIMSTWQRAGRVGRAGRQALIIMIGMEDALDQYFLQHPKEFFQSQYETAVIDELNPIVAAGQLSCAAFELPLSADDKEFYGDTFPDTIARLVEEGKLLKDNKSERWFSRRQHPEREISIRSIGETYEIIDSNSGRSVGDAEVPRVYRECHPAAIYLHGGEQYEVMELDNENKRVKVRSVMVDYYTQPRSAGETEILQVFAQKKLANDTIVRLGRVKVTEQVTGFVKKQERTQVIMGEYELKLPAHVFETVSLWIEIPETVSNEYRFNGSVGTGRDFNGGIHAIEHAAISIFPLFAMCDRMDLGGLSIDFHPQTNKATIFIYDAHPGGVGLSSRAYQVVGPLLEKTAEMIRSCKCEDGCPTCIQDPFCGNGNKPLDKQAALKIIRRFICQDLAKSDAKAEQMKESPEKQVKAAIKAVQAPDKDDIVFFDLETKFLADEVGGWGNIKHMKMSLGSTFHTRTGQCRVYEENDIEELIKELKSARLIVGFNIKRFDWKVLQPYTNFNLETLPTFDMLDEIHSRLGFRLSLEHLGLVTLNRPKVGNGLEVVQWFREGRIDMVREHCRRDVELTRDIFFFGRQNGYLLYKNKAGETLQLRIDFNR